MLLGYVGWQYLGTNWVSHRTQADIVDKLTQGWAEGEPSVHVDQGDSQAIVKIPRFGDDYEVPVIEGTSDDALAAGLGHFEGTAAAGQVGNFALAGHRVTHGQPLADMTELEVGDNVVVETADSVYTYTLVTGGDDLRVSFTDGWVIDPLPTNPDPGGAQPPQTPGGRLLTLTTCAELFHTDDRLVAFGVLSSTRSR